MQVRVNPNGTIGGCGCGRSRTGSCDGSHSLTEEQWARLQIALAEDKFLNEKNLGGNNDEL